MIVTIISFHGRKAAACHLVVACPNLFIGHQLRIRNLYSSFSPIKKKSGFFRKIPQTMATLGLYSIELRLSGHGLLCPHP